MIVLLREHHEDEEHPEWAKPIGLDGYLPHQLAHIGIEMDWHRKWASYFSPLDPSVPCVGGPQANDRR